MKPSTLIHACALCLICNFMDAQGKEQKKTKYGKWKNSIGNM